MGGAPIDWSRRSTTLEIMDGDGLDYAEYRACMADLRWVNVFTLAYRPTLMFLERLRREGRLPEGRPLAVLDVGFGYGDMLRAVDRWARRHGVAVALTGVDLNPWAARTAAAATPEGRPIRWLTGDAYAQPECDVVISALFTHHLADAELVKFLAWSERTARLGWFVNDLHRHPLAYLLFGPLCRAMGWRPIVRKDGLTSITRAFKARDWRGLLKAAGLAEGAAEIRWRLMFRLCVARVKG
jgi:SAM-dependent methyltransferase